MPFNTFFAHGARTPMGEFRGADLLRLWLHSRNEGAASLRPYIQLHRSGSEDFWPQKGSEGAKSEPRFLCLLRILAALALLALRLRLAALRSVRLPVKAVLVFCLGLAAPAFAADNAVKLTRLEDRVRIEIGGTLFSEYRYRGAPKPCLFPILDADGVSYTRNWPMQKVPDEVHDHDWHRSVWFGLGLVNGHDFWREIPARKTGSVVHDAILEVRDGPEGLIRARSRWEAADGKVICTDVTSLRVRRTTAGTFVDFEITLKASHGALTLGDTEEGAMAVRVNEAIRVVLGEKPALRPGTGHIVNSAGDRETPAWGKRAAWCDISWPAPRWTRHWRRHVRSPEEPGASNLVACAALRPPRGESRRPA
jgi:hypothetical protein